MTVALSTPIELMSDVPHLDEYFGIWAVNETPFRALVDRANTLDINAHIQASQAVLSAVPNADQYSYQVTPDRIAVIDVNGPLMKYASSLSGGSSTVRIRNMIRNAVRNEDVDGILLRIDSPGGTVSGTMDLAQDVAAATEQKPVHAFVDDMAASAAYWVASQADSIWTNATGLVGSIGTFMVIYDLSQMAEQEGIKAHVIRAGKFKGAGTAGTEITDEQLAVWQENVDHMNQQFLDGVSAGRTLSPKTVSALADGRVHVGQYAVDLQLADGVRTFDEAYDELRQVLGAKSTRSGQRATEGTAGPSANEEQPMAATLAELKAALPGADPAFVLEQLEAEATVEQALGNFIAHQQLQLEAKDEELAKAEKKTEAPQGGIDDLNVDAADDDPSIDAREEWNDKLEALVAKGMSRHQATSKLSKSHPQLREALLAQANA